MAGPTGGPTAGDGVPYRRLHRIVDGRALAGVAGGIADHVGAPRIAVRLAFVALLLFSGLGAVAYAVYWAVVPTDPAERARGGRRDVAQLVAFVALAAGAQLAFLLTGDGGAGGPLAWSLVLATVGAGVIWHRADPVRRRQWGRLATRVPWLASAIDSARTWQLALRLLAGGTLVAVGVIGVLFALGQLSAAFDGLVFAAALLAGIAIVASPGLVKALGAFNAERAERIRSQERAEIAAMVHDQVLHTLALIQRRSDDPREVARLARGQERDLRQWLYAPTSSPTERVRAALEAAAAEVEDTYAVTVDVVVVGDAPVDDRLSAVVGATREALVNAGRHAGVDTVSLYAEVEPEQVSVFVRDRGTGFDLAAVDPDRHGVRGSVIDRMERHGGVVTIRTAPGEGTEVRLSMRRQPGGQT